MDLVVETDLGHDPDDFFALCYLIAAGVNIRTILISPGDPDQIAIARFLCDEVGLEIPIGVSKPDRTKPSSGSIHYDLLNKYKYPLEAKADGLGVDILENVFKDYPDAEAFVIGPVTSLGNYLLKTGKKISRATMQGGFLGYQYHAPSNPLPQFEGKTWMPTFNLNGDRKAGLAFLGADIGHRQMVGKNVCHGVLFTTYQLLDWHPAAPLGRHPASDLFYEAGDLYLRKHAEKKFHDPTAACLHLHPEIATWVRGKTTKMESGWGTIPDPEGDYICADVDEIQLWNHIMGMK